MTFKTHANISRRHKHLLAVVALILEQVESKATFHTIFLTVKNTAPETTLGEFAGAWHAALELTSAGGSGT